jgi:DNA polymerase-4
MPTNKTVFFGTGESKPIGKLEIPETMVKLLNPLSIQKIPMVGDVTFQLLSLEFALFRHYQKCPQKCCNK